MNSPFDPVEQDDYFSLMSIPLYLSSDFHIVIPVNFSCCRQTAPFEGLWNDLGNSTGYLKLVAVSVQLIIDD